MATTQLRKIYGYPALLLISQDYFAKIIVQILISGFNPYKQTLN